MCGHSSVFQERVNDEKRNRLNDNKRFDRMSRYAYKRWEAASDGKNANRWLKLRIAIERRWWWSVDQASPQQKGSGSDAAPSLHKPKR